jgi:glycosyltransferase involved in cell wall biosynthesis
MKILVPALGRINTQNRDGSEIRFSAVAKIWQKRGFETHLVLPPREERILKADGVKAKFHILSEKTTYGGENLFLILLIYLARISKAFLYSPPKNMNLIYIPSDFLIDLLPGLWWKRKSPKAKLIVCLFLIAPSPFQGYRFGYQKGWTLPNLRSVLFFTSQRLSFVLLKLFADRVFVLNLLDKQILEKHGLGGKVEVIDMGVDLEEYLKTSVPIKVYDACFLGRLHPQKGIFDLIKIWKMVCEERRGARLALIGGGSEEFQKRLSDIINEEGLRKNIAFLGFKMGEEKIKILKQSKIFVLPSFYESWGMVAVEAMAAGLPVVAYDLPIFPKIFSQGMIRVPIGDTKAFAQMVLRLLKDEAFYQKKKKEAKEQARSYDWEKVAAREMKMFQRI